MATSLQIAPQVVPTPGINLTNPSRSALGSLVGAVGRGFGSNQMRTNADGSYAPAHHILDAVLNGGVVNNAAVNLNAQKAQQTALQSQQLQAMIQDTQDQITAGNNVEQNQAKLASLQSQLNINEANNSQANGVATKAGVVSTQPGPSATPGMQNLAGGVSTQMAGNAGQQATDIARVLATPAYNANLGAGMDASAIAPAYDNSQKTQLQVPGVGGNQVLPGGQDETIAKGGASSTSTSSPFVTNIGGMPYAIPGANTVVGSSTEKPASVSVPTNPSIMQKVLGGDDSQTPTTPAPSAAPAVSPTPSALGGSAAGSWAPTAVNPIQSAPDNSPIVNGTAMISQADQQAQADQQNAQIQAAQQAQAQKMRFLQALQQYAPQGNSLVNPIPVIGAR